MTQKVKLPSGETINFPDYMTAPQIKAVLKKKYNQADVQPQTSFTPTLGDKARLFAQGLSYGFGDEITAGAKSLFSDRSYDDLVKEERDKIKNYQTSRPLESLGYELAGALPTAIGSGVGLLRLLPSLAKTSNLGKAVGLGAIESGAYGFGTGEGLLDSATNALISAPIGGVTGGTVSLVGSGLKRLATNQSTRTNNEANKIIKEALDADELSPQDLQQKAKNIPNSLPQTLSDLADANTRGLTYVASQGQSKGKKVAEDFLTSRNVSAPDRVTDNITNFLNPIKAKNVDDITNKLQKDASDLYEISYNKVDELGNKTPNLINKNSVKNFYDLDVFQKAIRETKDLVELDILDNPKAVNEFNSIFKFNNSTKKFEIQEDVPLEYADKIKQGIDDFIEKNTSTSVKTGTLSKKAKRKVVQLKNKYLETLDEQNPVYKNARKIFSDKTSVQDAFDEGLKYKRLDMDELSDSFKQLKTDPEKKAFRLGVSKSMNEEVIKKPDSASDFYKSILGSNKKKQLFKLIAPDEKSYDNFLSQLDREKSMFKTQKDVLLNSKTAPRELFTRTVDTALNPQGLVKETLGKLENFAVGRNPEELRGAIIDKLLNPNSTKQTLQQIIDADKKRLFDGLLNTQPLTYPTNIVVQQGLLNN